MSTSRVRQDNCASICAQAALLGAGLLLVAGCYRNATPPAEQTRNESLRFSTQPIELPVDPPFTAKPLNGYEQAVHQLNADLQQLAKFANSVRTGNKWPEIPDIFAEQFETSFIERNELQSAFLGDRIRIARWQLTDQTPTYYETIALRRLFRTLLLPWRNATPFRIEFQIDTVENRPNYFEAEILVGIAGNVDSQTIDATGAPQEIGRSATGVWHIIWEKTPQGRGLRIKQIEMLEHQETVNYVDKGILFRDCTRSVLRNDEPTQQQLAYGLDQWAKRMPGIDIIGENGLAIGDVNGDGLDDLYLCQPHGIGNLLLIQNPDGTAENRAAPWGVDILDNSVAALIIDIDNDGLQDLVVATETHLVLWSNRGNETFQLEHRLQIGHGTVGISAADYDQDGDLDLYLCKNRPVAKFDDVFPQPKNEKMNALNGGRNVLLRNDEAWEFRDVTLEVGLSVNNQRYTRSAVWLDVDVDGDLDLYLANEYSPDSLFENRNGWFREIQKSEISKLAANSTSASTGDFNRDGRPDLFVAADSGFTAHRISQEYILTGGRQLTAAASFAGPNRILFVGESDSGLRNIALEPPLLSSESSYASAVADFNNDAWDDIVVTNGWLTRSPGTKAESIFYSHLFDPANDLEPGFADAFLVQHELSDLLRTGDSFNGYQRNRLFLGTGDQSFSNYSNSSGLDFLDDARAVGATDWDGDGDVDLVVINRTAPRLRILQNQYRSVNGYLKLRLAGSSSNRDAIGSRVALYLVGQDQPVLKTLTAGSGRGSQSSKELHFGLGKNDGIEKVVVHWPSGEPQEFVDLAAGKTYRLVEGQSEAAENNNDRLRVAIEADAIEPSGGLPGNGRIRFYPTTRLPILQHRDFSSPTKQKWYQIENAGRQPLLCLFLDESVDNSELLQQWAGRTQEFADRNSDMLAVFHGNRSDNDVHVKKSLQQIEQAGFGFRWGALSAGGNDRLLQLRGQWFFDQNLPDKPFAILLDADGNVHYAYEESALNWDTIAADLQALSNRNFRLGEAVIAADEHWIENSRVPRFDRLRQRFEEIGYLRDAKIYSDLEYAQQSLDYLNRAVDLASQGNLLDAIAAAEQSHHLNPSSVDSMIMLADATRRYSLSPNVDKQTAKRLLRSAGDVLDEALELEPQNEEAILARAEIYRLQQDIENALNLLTLYLRLHPESWQVHAIVGRLYFYKREFSEAAQYLITAIENRPTLPYVAGDLGILYLLNNQFGDAAEFLRLATRLQPSDMDLKRNLAEAEFWKSNFEVAGELFEQVVKFQPTNSHPKQMLAWLKAVSPYASFRDGETGLRLIEPFIETTGTVTAVSLEIQAACYADIEQFDQALESQKAAQKTIETGETLEKYSPKQLAALRDRLEMYKRRRPFRLEDPSESPFNPLGRD